MNQMNNNIYFNMNYFNQMNEMKNNLNYNMNNNNFMLYNSNNNNDNIIDFFHYIKEEKNL